LQDSPKDTTTADEAYEQAMDQEIVLGYFLDLLTDHLMERTGNPLSDMRQLLHDAPIFDGHDLAQYSKVGQPGDAALAGLVRKLYGESVLAEYRRAVDRVECQGF
jgi:hypothetical protein